MMLKLMSRKAATPVPGTIAGARDLLGTVTGLSGVIIPRILIWGRKYLARKEAEGKDGNSKDKE